MKVHTYIRDTAVIWNVVLFVGVLRNVTRLTMITNRWQVTDVGLHPDCGY